MVRRSGKGRQHHHWRHTSRNESVPYILKRIEEQTPHVRPVSFSSLAVCRRASSSLTSYSCLLCPALLRKGNKWHWRKNAMRHTSPTTNGISPLPFRIYGRVNPQPIFQGMYRTEGNITYQTIGRAEKSTLRFEGSWITFPFELD